MDTIKKNNGFTLVEMLVSMVILSSVIVIATQAHKQFIVNSEQFSDKYQKTLVTTQFRELLFERIEQSVLYVTKKNNVFGIDKNVVYWIGDSKQLVAVTRMSLQNPKRSAVYMLSVIDNELIYCEKVMDSWIAEAGEIPSDICQYSRVIASDIDKLSIRYYGWPNSTEMLQAQSSEFLTGVRSKQQWFTQYHGEKTELAPEWIELTLTEKNEQKNTWLLPVKYHDSERLTLLYNQAEG
ncbi:putative uncharacterized general secretion pathway protein [Aliivibrio wodanis]|uniref:Uncharacterized general secretion pathway protein n=1 Tax=Aliivibrio wodanis TaxID=80852 RepID=A0A090IIF8_9GAMM|nr:putative uncharacterized general secretion pathway protein [Aliivibrio wodanis]